MMIPPLIRVGPPPPPDSGDRKKGFVILTERGWCIAKWDFTYNLLVDVDNRVPPSWRTIHPSKVLCWMPEDGS